MNHYLIFSAINDYFKDISSLDAGRIFSAYVYDNTVPDMILEEIIVHWLPEYYGQYKRNTGPFDLQEAMAEAARRGYCATKGIGRMGIAAIIEIDGMTFDLLQSRFSNLAILCNGIIPGKLIEVPQMDAEGLLDLMEDINDAYNYTRPEIDRYLSLLGTGFDIGQYEDATYFADIEPTASSSAIFPYAGLPALAVYFRDQGLGTEDVLEEILLSCSGTEPDSNPYLKDPETFCRRCAPIKEICKKNSLVEQIADRSVIEVLKKYSPEEIVGISQVKYACYDSGVILLAPYERKGAIIGFLDYSKMAALEDTISRIISYTEGSSLPEGFVLMNDSTQIITISADSYN